MRLDFSQEHPTASKHFLMGALTIPYWSYKSRTTSWAWGDKIQSILVEITCLNRFRQIPGLDSVIKLSIQEKHKSSETGQLYCRSHPDSTKTQMLEYAGIASTSEWQCRKMQIWNRISVPSDSNNVFNAHPLNKSTRKQCACHAGWYEICK